MKKDTLTVWTTDSGRELLKRKQDGTFEVTCCSVRTDELRDLWAAIEDALCFVPRDHQPLTVVPRNASGTF